MAKKKRASLNPETFSTSSGLLDDAKIKFSDCRVGMFDYGGKFPEAPAFMATLTDTEDDAAHEQVWTVGGTPQDWEIGDDGDSLIPISKKAEKGINQTSNFGMFLASLVNNGFPADTLDDMDMSDLDDMEAHVIRIEGKQVKDGEGKKKDNEVVVVDEIITLPGDVSESTTAEKDDKDTPSAEDEAIEFVNAVLKDDKEVTKKDLPKKAFELLKDHPARNEILELTFSDEFLKANWKLKGGVITKK